MVSWASRLWGRLWGSSYAPDHDYWYNPVGQMSASGILMTPEAAQKVSTFYRGVDLLSTSLAMLPLPVYRRLPNDRGKETAPEQPLFDILNRKPNASRMDAFQYRRMKMRHLILRGNGYDRILPGARGFLDQLVPLSPDRMRPEQLDSGRVLYIYREKNGTETRYTEEEIFHLMGASDDGVCGVSVVSWAKDSIGLASATESYAARLFSQGNLSGTTLKLPSKPTDEQKKDLMANFQHATSGLDNAHKVMLIYGGMELSREKVQMTGVETEFIASRNVSNYDIARWLGIPPHMLAILDKSSFNNIEHQGQEFVTYSLGPWLTLFEKAILSQLVLQPEIFFAEFKRDALVRGDIAARWQAYHTGVTDGVLTRNEVRSLENLNHLDGLDEPLTPAHIIGKQEDPAAEKPKDEPEPKEEASSRAALIAKGSAARLLRKEITAIQKFAVKHAGDDDAFIAAVTEFYAKHVELVADTLLLTKAQASTYCAGQANQIINLNWVGALTLWQSEHYAAGLAAIALEEAA